MKLGITGGDLISAVGGDGGGVDSGTGSPVEGRLKGKGVGRRPAFYRHP